MNLTELGAKIQELGLMQKAFIEFSKEEALALCDVLVEMMEDQKMPYFRVMPDGKRELVIPWSAPRELQTWKHEDGFPRMHKLLVSLGATDEEIVRYLGPDWKDSEYFEPGKKF